MDNQFNANYDEQNCTIMLESTEKDWLFIRLSQPERCILQAMWHDLDYEKLSKDWIIEPEAIKTAQSKLYKRLWLDALE